jgi:hypothetical protein
MANPDPNVRPEIGELAVNSEQTLNIYRAIREGHHRIDG